jgi:muramoyltetrapeptide carboxypeptidase
MLLPVKPPALRLGDTVRVVAPSSGFDPAKFQQGHAELERLGYRVRFAERIFERDGYFAGSGESRSAELAEAFREPDSQAVACVRGGYGADTLLPGAGAMTPRNKILLGFSDINSLQIFLWQKLRWVTLYGPMLAAGLNNGAGVAGGYHRESLVRAWSETRSGWPLELQGEALAVGAAAGVLLGGCLTMAETTLGTPWELDTRGALLLLEDRAMKPYQVDRSLMHLRHAGKFDGVRGVILGDFPECESAPGQTSIRDVFVRHCREVNVPFVWGVPFGHTDRALLTIPLGIRGRLKAEGSGQLEILEPACVEPG